MIQVTNSSGKHYINPHYIVEIEGETIHTRVDLANGKCLEVRETPEEIVEMINLQTTPAYISVDPAIGDYCSTKEEK